MILVPFLKAFELLIFPVIEPLGFWTHLESTGTLSATGLGWGLGFGGDFFCGNAIVPRIGAIASFFGGFPLPNSDKVGRAGAGEGAAIDLVAAGDDGFGALPPKSENEGLFGAGAGEGAGSGFFGAGWGDPPKKENAGAF